MNCTAPVLAGTGKGCQFKVREGCRKKQAAAPTNAQSPSPSKTQNNQSRERRMMAVLQHHEDRGERISRHDQTTLKLGSSRLIHRIAVLWHCGKTNDGNAPTAHCLLDDFAVHYAECAVVGDPDLKHEPSSKNSRSYSLATSASRWTCTAAFSSSLFYAFQKTPTGVSRPLFQYEFLYRVTSQLRQRDFGIVLNYLADAKVPCWSGEQRWGVFSGVFRRSAAESYSISALD